MTDKLGKITPGRYRTEAGEVTVTEVWENGLAGHYTCGEITQYMGWNINGKHPTISRYDLIEHLGDLVSDKLGKITPGRYRVRNGGIEKVIPNPDNDVFVFQNMTAEERNDHGGHRLTWEINGKFFQYREKESPYDLIERIGDLIPDDHECDAAGVCSVCGNHNEDVPEPVPVVMHEGRCRLREGGEVVAEGDEMFAKYPWRIRDDTGWTMCLVSAEGKSHSGKAGYDVVEMLDPEPLVCVTCGVDRAKPMSDEDNFHRCVCSACGHLKPVPELRGKYLKNPEPEPDDKLVLEAGGVYVDGRDKAWRVLSLDYPGEFCVMAIEADTVNNPCTKTFTKSGVHIADNQNNLLRTHIPAPPKIEMDVSWLYKWATCWAIDEDGRVFQYAETPTCTEDCTGVECWMHHGRYALIPDDYERYTDKHAPTLPDGVRWQDTLTFIEGGE